jgi:small subunit ribosomal protein S20
MPIKKSAKKYVRITRKRTLLNKKIKTAYRSAIKELLALIKDNQKEKAQAVFQKVQKALDKAAKRGVIKKNTAARKKSRLAKKLTELKK